MLEVSVLEVSGVSVGRRREEEEEEKAERIQT